MLSFKDYIAESDDFMDKRPRGKSIKRKYKIGHVVKINKPGHPWHGKNGTILKSKTITAKNATEYAVGIEGSNASERFMEDELDYTTLGHDNFVKGAKMKEPRTPRGKYVKENRGEWVHPAMRRQGDRSGPQPKATHDYKVGDKVVVMSRNDKREGIVKHVTHDKVGVAGHNIYYPNNVQWFSPEELKPRGRGK